jgi:hypothetical protein
MEWCFLCQSPCGSIWQQTYSKKRRCMGGKNSTRSVPVTLFARASLTPSDLHHRRADALGNGRLCLDRVMAEPHSPWYRVVFDYGQVEARTTRHPPWRHSPGRSVPSRRHSLRAPARGPAGPHRRAAEHAPAMSAGPANPTMPATRIPRGVRRAAAICPGRHICRPVRMCRCETTGADGRVRSRCRHCGRPS